MDALFLEVTATTADNEQSKSVSTAEETAQLLSALSTALTSWKDFDLTSLQHTVDSQTLEIHASSQQSATSRKELSQQTKNFKKLPDEEKLTALKPLLKSYQSEIDSLTKRCKTCELIVFEVAGKLEKVVDPAGVFSVVIENFRNLEALEALKEENRILEEKLSESGKEVARLKTVDSTVAGLKTRLQKYEAMLDDMVREKCDAKEAELKASMDEKIRVFKETEYSLTRQLNQAKDQLISLQNTHDVTQMKLIDTSSKQYEEEVAKKLGDLEILVQESEVLGLKVVDLERKNQMLTKELSEYRKDAIEMEERSSLTKRCQYQEQQITKLQSDIETLKVSSKNKESKLSKRIEELEKLVSQRSAEISELNLKLAQFSDYDIIKHELDVFKTVEFSSDQIDDSELSDISLEQLLLFKNNKLQNDLLSLKLEHESTTLELKTLTSEYSQLLQKHEETSVLVQQLESDLHNLQQYQQQQQKFLEKDPLSSLHENTPFLLEGVVMNGTAAAMSSSSSNVAKIDAGQQSLVPILKNQRDRYKQKTEQLDESLKSANLTIKSLQQEMGVLKEDNLKLYEKLRFVRGYDSRTEQVNIQVETDVTNKYKSVYEGNLDPFQRFHRQELLKSTSRLPRFEKATLYLTKLVIGNKITRIIFLVYAVSLHCLVLGVLYKLSGGVECRHDHEKWCLTDVRNGSQVLPLGH